MASDLHALITGFDRARPVLLAGPTASGKSALAMAIAVMQGRAIVNADALQVFGCWRVLTARPGPEDVRRVPHHLYGHVPADATYSVGLWLRELAPHLASAPVIVGGTGLYLSALTEGLADIPATDPETRARADARLRDAGLAAMVDDLDAETRAGLDTRNPMRVQRAWEVLAQTGRGLADWQRGAARPLVAPDAAQCLHLDADKSWLDARVAARFESMLAEGAWDEARAAEPDWDPRRLSARAIGAAELVAALRGEIDESEARARAVIASRQYAKRQRTWFRRRMRAWIRLDARKLSEEIPQHMGKRH